MLRITSGQRTDCLVHKCSPFSLPLPFQTLHPQQTTNSRFSAQQHVSAISHGSVKVHKNVCSPNSLGALTDMLKGPNQENTGENQCSKNLPSLSCFSSVIVHNPSCALENVSCNFIKNKERREYSWHVLYEPHCS